MINSYVKELEHNETPELPQSLVDLYNAAVRFSGQIQKAKAGERLKPSSLRLDLTTLLTDIEDAETQLKALRVGANKELVPVGINPLLRRMLRVTTEIANATVFADKGERITQRELVQIYHDSFPFDDLKTALDKHIAEVRASRLRAKMSHSLVNDGDVVPDSKVYVPPVDEKAARALQRKQASIRQQIAGATPLGKAILAYAKFDKNLPSTLRGMPFKAFHMPIVPDFKDMGMQIDPTKTLKALRFKVTMLADAFPVLENQFLIAFDHKALGLDSGVRKDKEGNFRVAKRTGPKLEIAANEATDKLIELLEGINEMGTERYALASTTFIPNPRNPKLWLAWVITENQRKGLARMTTSVEMGWGLPSSSIRGNSDDE